MPEYQPPRLPDETALLEGHLWESLRDPYPADAGKDVRHWVTVGPAPTLIVSDCFVEIVMPKGGAFKFTKWQFASTEAARQFGEMMLPYSMVVGLM